MIKAACFFLSLPFPSMSLISSIPRGILKPSSLSLPCNFAYSRIDLHGNQIRSSCGRFNLTRKMAKPKKGSMVDSYQTVSVNCAKCRTKIFRYKKKNGTKSNLIKCYIERIVEDSEGALERLVDEDSEVICPKCESKLARQTLIHGRPALKFVGGKIRMTKK